MGTGMKSSAIVSFAMVLSFLVAPAMADITLGLEYDDGWPWPGNQRWKDIAGNLYDGSDSPTAANSWRDNAYNGASVNVAYGVTGSQLTGTLTATGLKPSFAYQLKLEGSTDTTTNTILQNIGRTSGSTGYLVFGYFVTDASGGATVPFVTDSSYHVLFRTTGSTGTTGSYGFGTRNPATDGPVITTMFNPDPGSSWYDTDYSAATVGVYGQGEPGRAAPGTLFLPDGDYICKYVLTEESFHDSDGIFHPTWDPIWRGAPGGSWASPFKGTISFTVPQAVVPLPGAVALGVIGLGFANWRLRRRREA